MEKEPAKSETHDKILGGLSVDEPWKQMESLPISPSGNKMHQVSQGPQSNHNNMNLNMNNLKSDQNSSSNHNLNNQGAKPQSTLNGGPRSIHVYSQQNAQENLGINPSKSFTNSSNNQVTTTNEDQMIEPSPIKPNPDASQPPGDSFYNDSSLVYEDFE